MKTFQFIAEDAAKGLKIKLYLRFAKLGHSKKTPVVLYGHYTRNNWNCDSNLATVIHKLKEHINIIEKLGDDDFTTCINLCKKKNQKVLLVRKPTSYAQKIKANKLVVCLPIREEFKYIPAGLLLSDFKLLLKPNNNPY